MFNLIIFLGVVLFSWLSFWTPVYVLYYQSFGLDYSQVFSLYAIRIFISLLTIIPSGLLADKIGRKKVLIASSIFQIIGFVIIYFANNFFWLALGNVLIGCFLGSYTGTDIAYLYDMLVEQKREKYYKYFQTLIMTISIGAIGLASLAGGFVAEKYGYRSTILLNIAAYVCAFILELFLKEIKFDHHQELQEKMNFKKILSYIFGNKFIFYVSFYLGFINLGGEFIQNILQPLLLDRGIAVKHIGIVVFILLLLSGLLNYLFIYINSKLNKKKYLELFVGFILVLMPLLCFILTENILLSIGLIILNQVGKGISLIFIKDYSNLHVDSTNRATIFSYQGFISNVISVIFFSFSGKMLDSFGLNNGILIVGIGLICLASLPLYKLYKNQ